MAEPEGRIDLCEHRGCEFEQRLEYCGYPTPEIMQDGHVIADFVGELIYEDLELSSDLFMWSGEAEAAVARRNLPSSFLISKTCEIEWIQVDMAHYTGDSGELYRIDVEQSAVPDSSPISGEASKSQYRLHFPSDGEALGVISESQWFFREDSKDIVSREITRNMSHYDYLSLFDVLATAYEVRYAEIDDNRHTRSSGLYIEGQD